MDNLSTHKSYFMKQYCSIVGLNILFNGAYNCEINVIEYVFGQIK